MQEFIIQYRRNKEEYVVNLKKQSSILCLYELLEKKKRCHSKWSCVDIWFMLGAHVAQYGPFLYSASSEAFLIYFFVEHTLCLFMHHPGRLFVSKLPPNVGFARLLDFYRSLCGAPLRNVRASFK